MFKFQHFTKLILFLKKLSVSYMSVTKSYPHNYNYFSKFIIFLVTCIVLNTNLFCKYILQTNIILKISKILPLESF